MKYKCGHKTKAIILDDNILSMSGYLEWEEYEKDIDKRLCFDCWYKSKKDSTPTCIICNTPMINDIDSVTKKVSKYLWKLNCKHAKNLRLSIG